VSTPCGTSPAKGQALHLRQAERPALAPLTHEFEETAERLGGLQMADPIPLEIGHSASGSAT
jgi:hypothetical protein